MGLNGTLLIFSLACIFFFNLGRIEIRSHDLFCCICVVLTMYLYRMGWNYLFKSDHVNHDQALTGTRYPTLPGFYFYYPYPTRNFFQNFRVQGSNSTCCFLSRINDYINDASQSTPEEERKFTKDCEYWQKCRARTKISSIYKWPYSCSTEEEKNFLFSCPEQLNRWPCHWLTH